MEITERRAFLRRMTTSGVIVSIGSAILPLGRLLPADAQVKPPTLADDDLAAFAESVELAAVEAYRRLAGTGKITTPAVAQAATSFAAHHQEHAAASGAGAGAKATHQPNPKLLQIVTDQLAIARDETGAVKIMVDLENGIASTYMYALGSLRSADQARLVASILPVESQHAVLLGRAIGLPDEKVLPDFETQDGKFDPTAYPVQA